ncbi:hypothetical protein [Bradyrhizobium sp. S69]|uniref:hypothetical protein n=1 Tax=Bradyrhizobium sp. S69 TaxID=1641856 RepID=UPI00131D84E0|nr:hypothetical protein [Bradyrhizobium sp. S69]
MRSILALRLAFGLSIIALCASTGAAAAHRFKPHHAHLHAGHRVAVPLRYLSEGYHSEDHYPAQRAVRPKHFAVPGWTDQETSKWLYDASAGSGKF